MPQSAINSPDAAIKVLSQMTDPTSLTTAALHRELNNLKELINTRFAAIDKATEIFEENLNRFPTEVDKAIGQLRELHEAKFSKLEEVRDERSAAVTLQFDERDKRFSQINASSKLAIDSALQAAKEAVVEQNKASTMAIAKSEAAFTKQIENILTMVSSNQKTLDDKIDDVKNRHTMVEQQIATILGKSSGAANLWGVIVGAVGVMSGIIGFIAFVMSRK